MGLGSGSIAMVVGYWHQRWLGGRQDELGGVYRKGPSTLSWGTGASIGYHVGSLLVVFIIIKTAIELQKITTANRHSAIQVPRIKATSVAFI